MMQFASYNKNQLINNKAKRIIIINEYRYFKYKNSIVLNKKKYIFKCEYYLFNIIALKLNNE